MARWSLRFLNGLISLAVAMALLCTVLYAGFALWDNHRIYEEADSVFSEMRAIKARFAAASQAQAIAPKANESNSNTTDTIGNVALTAAQNNAAGETTAGDIPAEAITTDTAATVSANRSSVPEEGRNEAIAANAAAATAQNNVAAGSTEINVVPAAAEPAGITETVPSGEGTALSNGQIANIAATNIQGNTATDFQPVNTGTVVQQGSGIIVTANGVSGTIVEASQVSETPAATPVPEPVYEAYGAPFDELIEINPDVNGWLTMPGTAIDYPLVQGATNYTYLNKDVYGNFALSGTIYLDSRNDKYYTDLYSLLYGHNMSKHRMFGDVNLYKDEKFFEENREGQLFLRDREHSLITLSCIVTTSSDSTVFNPENWEKMTEEQILSAVEEKALHVNEDGVAALKAKLEKGEQPRVLALSTCSSEFTDARTILLTLIDP